MTPIQSFQIPVEIFVVFLENEKSEYCASQIRDLLNEKWKLSLYTQRVNQILTGLNDTGRLLRETRPRGNGHNSMTHFYRLNLKIAGLNGNSVGKLKQVERLLKTWYG